MTLESRLVCHACGFDDDDPFIVTCPNAWTDDGDHVLTRNLDLEGVAFKPAEDDPNPFIRYRHLLHVYRAARRQGTSDDAYVARVRELDRRIAAIDGRGLTTTPGIEHADLASAVGIESLWVKNETENVAGSHKVRHLFGALLHLDLVAKDESSRLAIASCGNAALAAAVLAKAGGRDLQVFVPPHATPSVLRRLRELGVELVLCARAADDPPGDPCVLRYRDAVADGAFPFTVQGVENGTVIEGGTTLVYEVAEALLAAEAPPPDHAFVQVGGGALLSAFAQGARDLIRLGVWSKMPRLHAVQSHGSAPFARAFGRVRERILKRISVAETLAEAVQNRSEFMWPWEEEPKSVAAGILDDETYDWFQGVRALLDCGGDAVIVSEVELFDALRIVTDRTGISVCATGTAGVAGLLHQRDAGELWPEESALVILSGVKR